MKGQERSQIMSCKRMRWTIKKGCQTLTPAYSNLLTDAVASLQPVIDKIKQLLDGIYEKVFEKRREAYKQQVLLNGQSLRMIKAVKCLTMADKADKVSAALQADGTTIARKIKVMIVDAVKDAKENEKSKKFKKANDKKGDKESKNWKGPPGSGAHAKKTTPKKNTKNSQTSAKRDEAGGKNNITPADNSKRKENSTKKV